MKKVSLQKNKFKNDAGFTVLETLVAISVLILSLTAAFSVAQLGLSTSISSRDEVTAYFLAQEGIEIIRNQRDNNSLNSLPWLTAIAGNSSDPCYFGNVCVVDPAHPSTQPLSFISCGTAPITSSPPNVCNPLNGDPVTGLFGYTSTWPATRFKREVQFESISANEVNIIIFISWTDRGAAKFFRVSESLFNRQ